MFLWFHRLLTPHCEHCIEMERAKRECVSCDILKSEVERLRRDNERLLGLVLQKNTPSEESNPQMDMSEMKPIGHSNFRSWNIRRQMLEEADRKAAQVKAEKDKELNSGKNLTINEIEKELGVQ